MHDPMVVAFTIRRPWPQRSGMGRGRSPEKRFEVTIHGGKWWRLGAWSPFVTLFGRRCWFPPLVTVWHVEPGGRDSGEVCKHMRRWQDGEGKWHGEPLRAWRWHVHHWKLQVHSLQSLRARLFDRCAMCGRKGRPNHSFQWNGKRLGWWKFRSREGLYHRECADLHGLRRSRETDERLLRSLFAAYRVSTDETEVEALARLTDPKSRAMEFGDAYRLTRLLGYKRDDDYNLVPARDSKRSAVAS